MKAKINEGVPGGPTALVFQDNELLTTIDMSSLGLANKLILQKVGIVSGFRALTRVTQFGFYVHENAALTTFQGLENIITMQDHFEVFDNPNLESIAALAKFEIFLGNNGEGQDPNSPPLTVHFSNNPKLKSCEIDQLASRLDAVCDCRGPTNAASCL